MSALSPLSRTEIYGDIRTAFNVDHIYQAHPHVVVDVLDRLWKVKWMGLGGTYLWSTGISAWSIGLDLALKL